MILRLPPCKILKEYPDAICYAHPVTNCLCYFEHNLHQQAKHKCKAETVR